MSQKDDVSVLPGNAPQLAGLADPVYDAVSAGAFEEIGTKFTEAADLTTGATDKVKSVVGDVDGAWDGASADTFVNYMNGFTAAGLSVSDVLADAAAELQNAGIAVQDARDALEGVFANLVTEVQALGGQVDRDELVGKVNEVVERYRPQVVEQVDAADTALTSAASALSGRGNEINPTFSAMADPSTSTFAPSGGMPIEWTPVPLEPHGLGGDGPGPGNQAPPGGMPPGGMPPGGTPPGEAPPGGMPPGGTPPGGTPPGGTPPGETPPGEAPPGETPPGETPPGEAPPGETPPGETPPGETPPGGEILDVARGELGYEEGPGDANKYGPSAAWCSSFATWVWQQSGVDIPSLPFTGDVYTWGEERGLAYDSGNLGQARPGDVLLFGTGPESTSTSTHIGVVESVDGGQVTLIEGNSSDRVQRVTHPLSSETFYGGVHPR